MTTALFMITLLVVGTILYIVCVLPLTSILNDNKTLGAVCATIITIVFIIVYCKLTPSIEQMIENDYYAMLEDRPECIDAGDFSLGCKKEYIEWQKDSIEKQHKFDSVKVALNNKQKELLK